MSELDKLELWLKKNGYTYERIEENWDYGRHQIVVNKDTEKQWDAICQKGSYGYAEGLLEIYGYIVTEEDGDTVVGWLNADAVINRVRQKEFMQEQMAKEPVIFGDGATFEEAKNFWYACAVCKNPLDFCDNFCRKCGSAIDWKGVKKDGDGDES